MTPALRTATPTVAEPLTGTAIRDYGRGRVCAGEGCSTVLRRSNPTAYCGLHEGEAETSVKPVRNGVRHDVVCAWCGKTFSAVRSQARYCSDKCRAAAFAKRRREEDPWYGRVPRTPYEGG